MAAISPHGATTAVSDPDRPLVGRVALITGAAGAGIGRATALRLGEAGATIVLTDAHERRTYEATHELEAMLETPVIGHVVDVTNRSACDAMLMQVARTVGAVDILVNNAAVNHLGPLPDIALDAWRQTIEVDLTACWYLSRACTPGMIAKGGGVIVHIASIAGMIGSRREAAYAAAKAGLIELTRQQARELGPNGIRVNAIAPGVVRTHFVEQHRDILDEAAILAPLQRVAEPREIAEAVLFLASDDSNFVTGQTLNVSGGRYMRP